MSLCACGDACAIVAPGGVCAVCGLHPVPMPVEPWPLPTLAKGDAVVVRYRWNERCECGHTFFAHMAPGTECVVGDCDCTSFDLEVKL